jgi:hypothetical protein
MSSGGWRRAAAVFSFAVGVACSGRDSAKPASAGSAVAVPAEAAHGADAPTCPADGTWHECSVLRSLERAGLAPHRDSLPVHEPGIAQPGMLVHLGTAALKVFLFADEAARKAVESALDTTKYVGYNQEQTARGEPSLIRAANLLAILESRRDAQRERVGDALTAGPPQTHGR